MYRGSDHDAGRKSQRKEIFADLLLWDTVRGPDGTGIAYIPRYNADEPAEVYKRSIIASDFLQMKPAGLLLDRMNSISAAIGHNRFATKGSLDHNSAHPHQSGHITLVHNGTLVSYKDLATNAPAEVDSAYIAAGMAQHGEKETLEKLNGSFALVWHNAKDKTLNFARNSERPLVWVYDGADTLWYGSEWEMLFAALNRRGSKYTSKFQAARPHVWYSFPMNETREYNSVPFVYAPPKVTTPAVVPIHGGARTSGRDGGTTRTKAERKAEARLLQVNYKLDQLVSLRNLKWIPYKQNRDTIGRLAGLCGSGSGMEVMVHNVKKEDWRKLAGDTRAVYVRLRDAAKEGNTAVLYGEIDANLQRLTNDTVKGPHGQITRKAFLELTIDGCQNCGRNVCSADADKVSWYGDTPSVICEACTDKVNNHKKELH